jgi:hypothetical protein
VTALPDMNLLTLMKTMLITSDLHKMRFYKDIKKDLQEDLNGRFTRIYF